MSGKTSIEWTRGDDGSPGSTWNPVTGCSKVSPGCEHCYAETIALRFGRSTKPWTKPNAAENVQLHPERLEIPLKWQRPRRIFVNSVSDLFHELVPSWFVASVFAVMAAADHHTYQILTKRPERMRQMLSDQDRLFAELPDGMFMTAVNHRGRTRPLIEQWPLPNVWLGTSVEDQRRADERIPRLIKTPAAVRFLSCEPLLGPVDLKLQLKPVPCPGCGSERRWERLELSAVDAVCDACGRRGAFDDLDDRLGQVDLHWIIVGGESGNGFRPIDLDWARSIRDQCQGAGVPFFFKQVGGRTPKIGGRELDGRTWDEFPVVMS